MSLHGRVVSAIDRVELDAVSLLTGLVALCLPALVVRLLWRTHAEFRAAVLGTAFWLLVAGVVAAVGLMAVLAGARALRRRWGQTWHDEGDL